MRGEQAHSGTRVGRFARAVFLAGFSLTFGTGLALFLVPGHNADYWAWTIKAPLSAAFLGAGYLGAAFALLLAARTYEWRRARIVAVLAFVLTSLALVETLRNLGPFAFGDGGVPELVAWIWLAVYVALPPLVLVAFVRQERAGGSTEYEPEWPPLPTTRIALGGAGVAVAAIGIGLLVDSAWLTSRWPWPLPPLPATIVGAWFCTFATALLWFALRERDWSRARIGVRAAAIPLALDLVSAVRFRHGLVGSLSTGLYVGGVALLVVVVGLSIAVEERRLRDAFSVAAQPAEA